MLILVGTKNDYHCVTTGSHLVWFNLTSNIEIQHVSYRKKKKRVREKEGGGEGDRGTECNIMDGRKVTRVQSIMRNYL